MVWLNDVEAQLDKGLRAALLLLLHGHNRAYPKPVILSMHFPMQNLYSTLVWHNN